MSVNNFDVLKRMAAENKSIQLCGNDHYAAQLLCKKGRNRGLGWRARGNICFDLGFR